MHKIIISGALAALTLGAGSALADRLPSTAERTAIETLLRANGYTSWEEIELDDDGPMWEVDDARTPDGKRYDLKLQPGSLKILSRDLER